MPTCRLLRSSLLLFAACSAAADLSSTELSVAQVVAARRSHPSELETQRRLASAARHLARASGIVLHGATISAALGPRRGHGGGTSTDLSVGVDLPLLFATDEQRSLAAAIEAATPVLLAAARATAELEVELAYLAAWRDAEELRLRERELAVVEDWLTAVQLRVEAGAEPPFRVTVALGERERVAAQRDQARMRAVASRLALAALSALPNDEARLGAPNQDDPIAAPADPGEGLLHRAVVVGAELDAAAAALAAQADTARWSLAGEIESEGDGEVARFGLAYRIAPRGERRTVAEELLAAHAALARSAELEIETLETRRQVARRTLESQPPTLEEGEIERAFGALAALVAEGKERPTDVLAERRALVDARVALLEVRTARAVAAAELRTLLRRTQP